MRFGLCFEDPKFQKVFWFRLVWNVFDPAEWYYNKTHRLKRNTTPADLLGEYFERLFKLVIGQILQRPETLASRTDHPAVFNKEIDCPDETGMCFYMANIIAQNDICGSARWWKTCKMGSGKCFEDYFWYPPSCRETCQVSGTPWVGKPLLFYPLAFLGSILFLD